MLATCLCHPLCIFLRATHLQQLLRPSKLDTWTTSSMLGLRPLQSLPNKTKHQSPPIIGMFCGRIVQWTKNTRDELSIRKIRSGTHRLGTNWHWTAGILYSKWQITSDGKYFVQTNSRAYEHLSHVKIVIKNHNLFAFFSVFYILPAPTLAWMALLQARHFPLVFFLLTQWWPTLTWSLAHVNTYFTDLNSTCGMSIARNVQKVPIYYCMPSKMFISWHNPFNVLSDKSDVTEVAESQSPKSIYENNMTPKSIYSNIKSQHAVKQ